MRRYVDTQLSTVSDLTEFEKLKTELRDKSFNRLRVKQASFNRAKQDKKRQKKKIKGIRKKRISERAKLLTSYGNRLEANLPPAEAWFRELYFKEDIQRSFSEDYWKDQFNVPFNNRYIPDVSNRGYRYIIEIDEEYHNTPEQKFKDDQRDYYFRKREYLVVRIKDRDMESYTAGMALIKVRIAEVNLKEASYRGTRK